MRQSRKIILIVVTTVLVLGGILGGVAIAKADDQNTTTTTTTTVTPDRTNNRTSELFDKVAEIYQQNTGVAVDSGELSKAFKQAEEAIRNDRLGSFLDKLVENGKITQDKADELKDWWSAKPDLNFDLGNKLRMPFGNIGKFGGMFRSRCFPENDNT